MTTDEFSFAVGVVPGYFHLNDVKQPLEKVVEAWRAEAEDTWNSQGIFVAGVIHETRTVYRAEWGCPLAGEVTFMVTGLRNPEFQKDRVLWLRCVEQVCRAVKVHFGQATAYLSFREVEFEYLR